MTETVTAQVLAAWLNLSARRIRQLCDEGVVQRAAKGEYLLRESVTAYCQLLQGQGGADEDNGVGNLSSERAALAKAQRERTELQNAVLRSELVPAGAAVRALQALASSMKTRLVSLPDVVRQRHPDVSLLARAEIASLIEDALRQVATSGLPDEYRAAIPGDGGDTPAGSETDVEPVGG